MTKHIYPAHEGHFPVMLNEVMALLDPQDKGVYVDATFGGGGYSKTILSAAACEVWGIDRDPDAIARGQEIQKEFTSLHLLQGDFSNIKELLASQKITECNGIVLDLGVSSFQIDQAERGFSFRFDGPLDMRMSRTGKTAADLVNTLSETELADILFHYGEERFSRRIAKAIVQRRIEAPFETTQDLAGLIQKTIHGDKSGINPATRSFQGLRIAVNNELEQIHIALQAALNLLKPGGKLIVVSFHSLEDRIAKDIMNKAAGRIAKPSRHLPLSLSPSQADNEFELLTSKPQRPSEQECQLNPRSRSARLRAIKRRL
ncbi:16S rRNA (cytosine(1402)-N(4))-methyltransferase RsmH [Commensalibacter papalotli (ex Servin-Garciduenas et al. 2014)]|uniref:Ribosomal RNA small subunit methyltransferase H n=1 Tax=Commensalibacter papalotli (ex Servin-Garciduenas et al. 2014) TaxID=1208583 RepID=W7E4W6_9PROT|nr:16S rRNA (cytosine(1402)-N(4))-methyltransferase RsmH [Commensalibacter papalotli (ex Servin-Garciduenas et al. 2014)]EUK18106.1 16S rRNA m(4)C1402 methyltransferase [Commensalibacter papalotli (ex Servin-Garciduenas et al. 2014)]